MPLRFRARSARRKRGLAILVVAAFIAALVVAWLRLGGDSADSSAPHTASELSAISPEAAPIPTAAQVLDASRFAARRSGRVSFAVVDTAGALACYRCRISYHSASVVKAMLLVAYLDRLAGAGRTLAPDHEAYLERMIRVSDNDAATAIYADVGDRELSSLADQARMTDFLIEGSWGHARITAADQARFFANLPELAPPEYQGFVRTLLSSIVPRQSWGIPEVSRPEWLTMFKGGWLTSRRGSLVHQVARLEKDGLTLAIAILTDGNPSDVYGRETVRGIAARLLGR